MSLNNVIAIACYLFLTACMWTGGDEVSAVALGNNAPNVDAGPDITLRLPDDTVPLDGSINDDGRPVAVPLISWSLASGPQGVTFGDPGAAVTSATFAGEGTYVLQLTVDDTEHQVSDTAMITVEAAPVLASIVVAPTTASLSAGGSQQFSASSTDQYGDAFPANITWSATGGTVDQAGLYVAGQTPGIFVVTATDGFVQRNADVTVVGSAPVADAGGPYAGAEGVAIALDASGSTDPNNDIVSYDWDLDNDGSYNDTSGAMATYIAGGSGVFNIGVRVTDASGISAADIATVTVTNLAPVANAGGPYSGDEALDISLDGFGSIDPGNDIVSYLWDFDSDGQFDDAVGVAVIFNSAMPGMYTVGLQVTDDDGVNASATASVLVNDNPPAIPLGVIATGETGQVSLDWNDNGEPDIAGYRVRRSLVQGGPYSDISGLLVSSDYIDTTVTSGTTYFYVVVAEDGGANVSATSTEASATPTGPLQTAYWRLDEGSGSTAADSVGNSDGTIMGAGWAMGVSNSALDFDGSSSHVIIDNTADLDITSTQISLVAWIYPRDSGASGGSRVIAKRTDAGGSDVYAMYTDDFRLRFRLDGQDMVSTHVFSLNRWLHVATVYDGTDKRIYVNGVLDLATPQPKVDAIDGSARAVHLGMRDGEARYFNGLIDEAQIFDRALTAVEVSDLYSVVSPPASPPGLFFTDITASAGTAGPIDGGHGVMFAEVDPDSLPDLYLTNNLEFTVARRDYFFINIDGASFSSEAQARGIDDFDGGSHGGVWADLDNDGDYDLFNGTTWSSANPFRGNPDNDNVYRNDAGVFTEVTSVSIQSTQLESRGVTAFDMDRDGDLDLFGVTGSSIPGVNEAFRNDGNFAFSTHVGGDLSTAPAMQGVIDTDFDGDGDIDILSANRSGDIAILQNDGSGTFVRISPATLGITHAAGDGITAGDVDNDGDLDLLLVSDGTGHLYLRGNAGLYSHQQTFGNAEGYMGGFADLDNDGDIDLVFAGDERIFENQGDGTFLPGQSVPVGDINDPRAIAFADIEGDGDVDFAIAGKLSTNLLIRNDFDAGNWLRVELVSPQGQAGAFGAKTRVYPAGQIGGTLIGMRESRGNHGYLAQDDPVLHFGLGTHPSVDVVVDFVDGSQTTVMGVAANQRIIISP